MSAKAVLSGEFSNQQQDSDAREEPTASSLSPINKTDDGEISSMKFVHLVNHLHKHKRLSSLVFECLISLKWD